MNEYVAVFIAATIGDLFTYLITSIQLGIAFPGDSLMVSIGKYMGVFMLTQVPIAIMEGILTVLVYNGVKNLEGGLLNETIK